MRLRLFSLAIVVIAVFMVVVDSGVAEAGNRRWGQTNQQNGNQGEYDTGFNGLTGGKPWGEGPINSRFAPARCFCQYPACPTTKRFHGLITTINVP